VLASLAIGCGAGREAPVEIIPPAADGIVEAQLVLSGLELPVYLSAPASDPRLFVVEQRGTIRVATAGVLAASPFLDISARVASGGERGLLSMAFDPLFASNRRFYVNFTDRDGNTRVERFVASTGDPSVADASSAELIIAIAQPNDNHNGGHLLFGPDGMLYIPMGDGGGSGDPNGNAQNPATPLGKLLRIDVRGPAPYAVPSDNPFVGIAGARPEIWALGLRNPWRIAIDGPTALLYLADVGEGEMEEVSVRPIATAGLNYGWNIMEGTRCFLSAGCSMQGLVPPVLAYGHAGGRCSITGGAVYRGNAMPSLRGHYFYADFCEDGLRSALLNASAASAQRFWDIGAIGRIASFGVDGSGELYVLSRSGNAYRLRFKP
jgi:glucose/arabinose dehydrogenase